MFYGLQSSIGFQLTLAARVNERSIEGVLAEHGLTRITWTVLVAIGMNSITRPSSIAEFLGVDRPTVSRALAALEKDGLVERSGNLSDARQISVQLTRVGNERMHEVAPQVQASVERFLSRLTPDERKDLSEILQKLNSERPTLKTL